MNDMDSEQDIIRLSVKMFLKKVENKTGQNNRFVPFVGVAGFEPATSWSQTRRDDRATLHPVNPLRLQI